MRRFHLATWPIDVMAELGGSEAHHLINVLRAKPGEEIEVFDGAGRVAAATIVKLGRSTATLELGVISQTNPSERETVIASAVPKGDRFEWMVEKLTELGISRLVPLATARSSVDPRDSKLERLRSASIAACKQSGRNHLLAISSVTPYDDFLQSAANAAAQLFLGSTTTSPAAINISHNIQTIFLIGPEGGFTSAEIDAATAVGAAPVSLGPHILRTETAAIAAAARLAGC
jgi:16S rRNA (uracil1498-N3)-methyltransferase